MFQQPQPFVLHVCKMARRRCDGTWTTTPNPHCSALSVFLWQQSPTIWRSLIPRIPLMAFLHRPTRLILVSRVFFFLFTSPRSFFTWSTYLITILFHLLSIILFFFCPFSFYSQLPFALFFFQSFSLRVFSSSICVFSVLCSLTSEVIHIHDPLDKHFISYCACRHTDVHKGA